MQPLPEPDGVPDGVFSDPARHGLEGSFVRAVVVANLGGRTGIAATATGVGTAYLRGCPTERRADLVNGDFDHAPLFAFLIFPGALHEASDHDHAGSLGQGLCGLLGLVAPEGAAEEGGFFLPLVVLILPALVNG